MGHYVTTLAQSAPAAVIAPLIPGIPVFGSGIREVFTSSGTFASKGIPYRVYVVGGAGGDSNISNSVAGAGAGAAISTVTPPVGPINIVIGAKGGVGSEGLVGGTSSFGTGAYLVSASGGNGGTQYVSSNIRAGKGIVGDLLLTGESTGSGCKGGLYGPSKSGIPSFPFGIGGGTSTEGSGVVIIEY